MLDILIISHYIAPTRNIASVRWTKIAKYVKRKHDVRITVITTKKNYSSDDYYERYSKDELLEKDMSCFDFYTEFETGTIQNKLFRIKKTIKRLRNSKASTDNSVGTSGSSQFAAAGIRHTMNSIFQNVGTKEIVKDGYRAYKNNKKKYDVIVSTYGPVWPHLLAKKIAKDNPGSFWLADFRDVYAGNSYETASDFNKHKRFVSQELKNATVITKVTEGFNLFEAPNQKLELLSNGFDWEERMTPERPAIFSLVYTGTFYPKETNLSLIFKAIRLLLEEKKIDSNDVKIIYAGKNGDAFTKQAEDTGVAHISKNMGFVTREMAMELQRSAAVLLQSYTFSSTFQSLWSGKMYEYMMAEKPIVFEVVGDTPSEQYKLMPKLGGIAVETCREKETFDDMKAYILAKYEEWKITGNVTIKRDEDYIRSFSYERIADSFWNIIGGED